MESESEARGVQSSLILTVRRMSDLNCYLFDSIIYAHLLCCAIWMPIDWHRAPKNCNSHTDSPSFVCTIFIVSGFYRI